MERKRTYTAMAEGVRTRRRAYSSKPLRGELNKIYKKLKTVAPLHMVPYTIGSGLTQNIPVAGNILDLHSSIAEGDAYNQRHGTVTRAKRILIRLSLIPGTAQVLIASVRICVFRATVGATVAQTLVDTIVSSSPIANNNITQVFLDRWFTVYPTAIDNVARNIVISIPIKGKGFRMNYNSAASGSQTGETLFFAAVSNAVAGATAPNWLAGNLELWFQP